MRLPWTFRGSCILVHIPRTSAAVGGLHAEPVWLKHFESHPGRAAISSKAPGRPRRLASVRTPSAQTSEMGRRSCRHGHLNTDDCHVVSRQLTSPHRVLTMHCITACSRAPRPPARPPTAESWPGGPRRSGRPPAKRQAMGPAAGRCRCPARSTEACGLLRSSGPPHGSRRSMRPARSTEGQILRVSTY